MTELLRLEAVSAGYGAALVIDTISLTVDAGRTLVVLGRNGSGKTTLIKTLAGLTQLHGGRLFLNNRNISRLRPDQRAAAGIGWVPQERHIFGSLTVDENLTAVARPGHWTPAQIYAQFPRLAERRGNLGGQLSGGEQQMLAIGRALVLNPRLLLLDEPLEGLAPLIAQEVLAAIRRIVTEHGVAAILVEQHARQVLALADDVLVLERGRIAMSADSAAIGADPTRLHRHLGVGDAST